MQVVVAFALSLVLAACADGRPGGGRDGLLAADRALGASIAGALTDDAYYLHPDRPLLQGREAIVRVLGEPPEAPVTRTPLVSAVSADGAQGFTAGRLLARVVAGSEATHAKYLAYWRLAHGEGWRLWAYVENPSPAAPDSVPPALARSHAVPPQVVGDSVGPAALLAADAAFSAQSDSQGAGPAFGEFAEPAALMLLGAGHGMVWGDTAIAGFIGRAIPPPDGLTWAPIAAHLAPGGDLGFTVGEAVYRHVPDSGAARRSYTKYLTIWRRQADGRWRYAADAGNDRPAPASEGDLRVEPARGGLRLVNPDTGDVYFIAFEQGTTALVNWRPCVDRATCRVVGGRAERLLPYDSIPGYTVSSDSATVFWWRRRAAAGGGWAFDSVRSAVVGVARERR